MACNLGKGILCPSTAVCERYIQNSIYILHCVTEFLLGASQAATAFTLPQNLDFTHLFQPEIVTLPRKALDLRFAVLLLRSTYDAVDAMNFVAMVNNLSVIFSDAYHSQHQL